MIRALISALFVFLIFTAAASASTVYVATSSTSGTTTADSDVLNSAVGSAISIANLYGFSAVQLKAGFDPSHPADLCKQGGETAQTAQTKLATGVVPTLGTDDLLIVLSIAHGTQTFNKYTGAYTNDVLLNATQLECPKPTSAVGLAPTFTTSGVISSAWGKAASGPLIENYLQNPLAGVAAVASLLTSSWVGKYRLWLAVPSTFLDSFKHEKRSLDGTIYCAATQAMLDLLYQNNRIHIEKESNGDLHALRHDDFDKKWHRVRGVNYCKQQQPLATSLTDPTTESAPDLGQ